MREPKYARHKRSNRAFVRLAGRQVYLPGAYDSNESRSAYYRVLAEWRSTGQIAAPASSSPGAPTVAVILDRFEAWAKNHYRAPDGTCTGEYPNIVVALRLPREMFGGLAAQDFGPLKLKAVRARLVENRKLSRVWIEKQVRIIRRCFKWAAGEELVPAPTWQALQAVAGIGRGRLGASRERPPVKPVSKQDVDAVLPFLNRQVRALVELQWWTAMRPGEALIMRTQHLDRTRVEGVWLYTVPAHKKSWRGESRVVPLGPNAQEIIRPFLRADRRPLFSPRDADRELREARHKQRQTPVQPSQKLRHKQAKFEAIGECYSVDSYRRQITRACKKAKIAAWNPGQLRHSAATRLRAELGVEVAAAVLGHSRESVIVARYAEMSPRLAIDAMKRLG